MARAKNKLRFAPSGPEAGDPALRVGPGSVGRSWRAHGASAATAILTTTVTALYITAPLEPGFLYDLEHIFPVNISAGITSALSFSSYYRIKTGTQYGSWVHMGGNASQIVSGDVDTDGAAHVTGAAMLHGISVTVTATGVEYGVIGDAANRALVDLQSNYGRILEYLP
jgi:hypothetical protein